MSQHLALIRLRLVKAAAAVSRRDPGTVRSAVLRSPDLRSVRIWSAVLPLCDGFAVMAAVEQTMRSTHLDDLAQLLNVIRGQMSSPFRAPAAALYLAEIHEGDTVSKASSNLPWPRVSWSFRH